MGKHHTVEAPPKPKWRRGLDGHIHIVDPERFDTAVCGAQASTSNYTMGIPTACPDCTTKAAQQ